VKDTRRAARAQQQYGKRSRGDDNALIRMVRLHQACILWGPSEVHDLMKPRCVRSCEVGSTVELSKIAVSHVTTDRI
jgi:hypothetical protein